MSNSALFVIQLIEKFKKEIDLASVSTYNIILSIYLSNLDQTKEFYTQIGYDVEKFYYSKKEYLSKYFEYILKLLKETIEENDIINNEIYTCQKDKFNESLIKENAELHSIIKKYEDKVSSALTLISNIGIIRNNSGWSHEILLKETPEKIPEGMNTYDEKYYFYNQGGFEKYLENIVNILEINTKNRDDFHLNKIYENNKSSNSPEVNTNEKVEEILWKEINSLDKTIEKMKEEKENLIKKHQEEVEKLNEERRLLDIDHKKNFIAARFTSRNYNDSFAKKLVEIGRERDKLKEENTKLIKENNDFKMNNSKKIEEEIDKITNDFTKKITTADLTITMLKNENSNFAMAVKQQKIDHNKRCEKIINKIEELKRENKNLKKENQILKEECNKKNEEYKKEMMKYLTDDDKKNDINEENNDEYIDIFDVKTAGN
jgi:hypothetical protein